MANLMNRPDSRLYNECLRKKLYKTKAEGEAILAMGSFNNKELMHVYLCPRAEHYHIGHKRGSNAAWRLYA